MKVNKDETITRTRIFLKIKRKIKKIRSQTPTSMSRRPKTTTGPEIANVVELRTLHGTQQRMLF